MTWNPTLHPRDPRNGEFVDRVGDGWVTSLLGQMSRGDQYHQGRDITGELDYEHMANTIMQPLGGFQPDNALGAIYDAQGFSGAPRVVDSSEMDRLVASGWAELWRGIQAHRPEQAARWAEDYRSGKHWPGQGVRGSGTYTSLDMGEALTFTQADLERFRLELREGASGQLEHVYVDSQNPDGPTIPAGQLSAVYDTRVYPGLMRIALRPDARTIKWDDLDALWRQRVAPLSTTSSEYAILVDEGRFAAALGYDAIIVKRGHVVVLNRTAVAVQEAGQ